MLTARGLEKDRVLGLDSGADDYLVKPFSFVELFARMRSILRRKKTVEAVILKVADLKLNPATYEVSRGGKIIRLSSKEYSLLNYLMRHMGQVISRRRLMEHLWGPRAQSHDTYLTVYMRYLRKKMDDSYKRKLIKTVKGFGYKIQE
jgi:DNA-binding response OmpR family regulator